jgi:glucose/arabinose dehydrogenase
MGRWALPGLVCAWLAACVEPTAPEPTHFGFPESFSASKAGLELARAFPAVDLDNPTAMVEAAGRFFVAQQNGRIYTFEPDGAGQTLVLDLSGRTQWGNDGGLLSIAAHPSFGVRGSSDRGYLYAYYSHSADPVTADDVKGATETRARLSRFTLDADTHVADPASELVLIELRDRHMWHQGGGMFFHPGDGFLYLALGDEGGLRCRFDNCQRIDKSLYGGVLRIDVDRRGGEVSHPIVHAPEEGHTDHYFIPNDNPFLGEPNVLEEFYAVGLRNPPSCCKITWRRRWSSSTKRA